MMGLGRTTGLASAVAVAGVWLFAACSSFDGDSGTPLPDAGAPETGATSSSSSSSSGTSGASSSSGTLHVDAGGDCPVSSCREGSVLCDNFEREAPAGTGTEWGYFQTEKEPNFLIEPGVEPCGRRLKAYVGVPASGAFAARMLTRLLNGTLNEVTVDFDLTVFTNLEEYEDETFSALVALTPDATFSATSAFAGIVAVHGNFAMAGQRSDGKAFKTENFTLMQSTKTHITWRVNPESGASSIDLDGARVKDTVLPDLSEKVPTQLHLFIGVASKGATASNTARFDNVSVSIQ